MWDKWKFLTALAGGGFGTGVVAIVADKSDAGLFALFAGAALVGTAAIVFRSPMGNAMADYIKRKAVFLEDRSQASLTPHRPQKLSHEERQKIRSDIPAGIVVIMFTDMEDFTRYIERGDETAYRVLQRHNRIIRDAAEQGGGRIVKSYGDGFMIAFASARKAVLSAVAMQQLFRSYNRDRPDSEQIRVRIGLDAGEPMKEGDDYIGRTVNVASRIALIGEGEQILVSETVRQLVGHLNGLQDLDRGMHALKGFSEKQKLFEIAQIEVLAYPLDSDIESEVTELERRALGRE